MNSYDNMQDTDIIDCINNNDNSAMEYMMQKYSNLVRKESRAFFLMGAESDDLIQEGMIGLFKAISGYKKDRDASFITFATLCVRNQIKTAVTSSNSQKHIPLNQYVSIYGASGDTENVSILDILNIADENSNPEKMLIADEAFNEIHKQMETKLSKLERKVITLYLEGWSYQVISEKMDISPKSVDNAIQRIRGKLQSCLK